MGHIPALPSAPEAGVRQLLRYVCRAMHKDNGSRGDIRRLTPSRLAAVLVAAVFVASPLAPARAHSLLFGSDRPARATLTASPCRLVLRFSNRIERRLCHLRLLDSRGESHTLMPDGDDRSADHLTGPLPLLAPGASTVEWQVLFTDEHLTRGSLPFHSAP